jgi:hypothetical protein
MLIGLEVSSPRELNGKAMQLTKPAAKIRLLTSCKDGIGLPP